MITGISELPNFPIGYVAMREVLFINDREHETSKLSVNLSGKQKNRFIFNTNRVQGISVRSGSVNLVFGKEAFMYLSGKTNLPTVLGLIQALFLNWSDERKQKIGKIHSISVNRVAIVDWKWKEY